MTASDGVRLSYVHILAVRGPGEQAYADSLRGAVRSLTSDATPCGWIVEASGDRRPWFYDDGRAGVVFLGGWFKVGLAEVEALPHRFDPPHPSVAVLTDGRTASSGEAVAVAFRGRPNARSFGASTMGKTTGNQTVRLPDGARLFVTGSVYADRAERVYGDPLALDVRSTAPEADARAWLAQQSECSGSGGA